MQRLRSRHAGSFGSLIGFLSRTASSRSFCDSSSPRAVLEEVGIVLAVSAVPECSWQMSPRNRPGSPPAPRDWGQLNRVVPEPRAADDLKVSGSGRVRLSQSEAESEQGRVSEAE